MDVYLIILIVIIFFFLIFIVTSATFQTNILHIVKLNKKMIKFVEREEFIVYADLCFETSNGKNQHLLVDLKARQVCLFNYEKQYMLMSIFLKLLVFKLLKMTKSLLIVKKVMIYLSYIRKREILDVVI